jgi:hypothetical protein
MGHAGRKESSTLDVYSKSWWEERVYTVTRVVEAVMTEPEEKSKESNNAAAPKPLRQGANGELWKPQGGYDFHAWCFNRVSCSDSCTSVSVVFIWAPHIGHPKGTECFG